MILTRSRDPDSLEARAHGVQKPALGDNAKSTSSRIRLFVSYSTAGGLARLRELYFSNAR